MRLLDTYSLYCGAKIDKPFIYETYFPLLTEKYITFQAETPYDSRNYAYWQDVIDMILPHLNKMGISILQLGLAKEVPYQRVINLLGQTSYHQLAYIVRRSMLHFGPDSFGVHLASHFDIPVTSLYSISMPEVAGPHFGSPEKHILFKGYERVGTHKPSYSPNENPKSINTIKPEEVSNAILSLLKIEDRVPIATVYSGNRYSNRIVREIIPNSQHVLPQPEQPVEIRCDLFFDEGLLVHHLNYWQKAIIITDKPINIELLKKFKPHIAAVAYSIGENDNPDFVKNIINAGIQIAVTSRLSAEQVQAKKIKYYQYGTINMIPIPALSEELKKETDKLYFRSCKLVSSNGQFFPSIAHWQAGTYLSNDFEYHKVIDSPLFWQDLEFFTIVKKI